jgi:hypothetical protein
MPVNIYDIRSVFPLSADDLQQLGDDPYHWIITRTIQAHRLNKREAADLILQVMKAQERFKLKLIEERNVDATRPLVTNGSKVRQ